MGVRGQGVEKIALWEIERYPKYVLLTKVEFNGFVRLVFNDALRCGLLLFYRDMVRLSSGR